MLGLSLVGSQPEVMYPKKTGVPCTLTPSDHVMGNLRDAMRNLQQISCNMDTGRERLIRTRLIRSSI